MIYVFLCDVKKQKTRPISIGLHNLSLRKRQAKWQIYILSSKGKGKIKQGKCVLLSSSKRKGLVICAKW